MLRPTAWLSSLALVSPLAGAADAKCAMSHLRPQVLTTEARAGGIVVANETIESAPGDKVTLFWVDASGRISPATRAITVTGKPAVEAA